MPKNTDAQLPKINLPTFVGGEAIDFKNGISGSFFSSQALDFRQKASQMTVLPGMRTLATSTQLRDKITAMDQDINGIRYGLGDQGWLYSIDNSNNIARIGQLNTNGAAGCIYNQQNDQLYVSDQQSVSMYGQVTQSSPKLRKGQFGASASVAPGVIYTFNTTTSSYDGGTDSNTGLPTVRNNLNSLTLTGITPGNYAAQVTNALTGTYTLPTLGGGGLPSETLGQFCAFVPDIEPFYGVALFVTTVGTGDYTLTMHDSLNNNIGSVTVPHAKIRNGWNMFKFADPGVRAFVNAIASSNGATGYHFHLTSSVSSDTAAIATIANGNLTGANFVLFAHRLVQTENGWHPMVIFNSQLLVGNSNYLSVYNFGNDAAPNNNQWVRHRLFFDVGYQVTSIAYTATNVAIFAERRSLEGSRNYQGGMMYIWDGISSNWIQKTAITMGAPYSANSNNNVVYFVCAGSLYAWSGGTSFIKVRYLNYQNTDYLGIHDNTVLNPNMMDTRYNILLIGFPSSTTIPTTQMGIYSWGAVELAYPNSFGYSYALANGKQTASGGSGSGAWTNLEIGMIKNFVDTLYTSWQYTDNNSVVHYGLDVTDNTASPAPAFNFASLIWDGGAIYKPKKGLRLLISFLPLPADVMITGWYDLDRNGQTTTNDQGQSFTADQGMTSLLINVPYSRAREIMVGFNGTCDPGATTPTIIGITFEIDALEDEPDLREYEPVNSG